MIYNKLRKQAPYSMLKFKLTAAENIVFAELQGRNQRRYKRDKNLMKSWIEKTNTKDAGCMTHIPPQFSHQFI